LLEGYVIGRSDSGSLCFGKMNFCHF
jgi:hypothetical protein